MPTITLTDDQAAILADATEGVTVLGPGGRPVGFLDPRHAKLMATACAEPRRDGEESLYYSGEQIRTRLRALDNEAARLGKALSVTAAAELLARLRETDPPRFDRQGRPRAG